MRSTALITLVFGAALQAAAQVADPAKVATIIAQLEAATTTAARFNILKERDVSSW